MLEQILTDFMVLFYLETVDNFKDYKESTNGSRGSETNLSSLF